MTIPFYIFAAKAAPAYTLINLYASAVNIFNNQFRS